MLPEAILLSLIIALFRKGKLSYLGNIHIKGWYLIVLSALVQQVCLRLYLIENEFIVNLVDSYYLYIHILSYLLLFTSLILNLDMKSFKYLFIGTLLNFICIITNNGRMPVHVPFGPDPQVDIWHSILNESTNLIFLADVIPLPQPYPFPKILSIGDLLIIVGAFIFIQNTMVNKKKYASINYIY